MSQYHQIDWISEEVLVDLIRKNFYSSVAKITKPQPVYGTDPTLNIFRSVVMGKSTEEVQELERVYSATKTLQNAIGAFHQELLGSVDGWISTGSHGGLVDLKSTRPMWFAEEKFVVAEVKMRYNTIKASDEKNVWDSLRNAAVTLGQKDHQAYIIQIVPKNRESYDRPWKVSGREASPLVRQIDGVTGYYYVTGSRTALRDLMFNLPRLLKKAFPNELKNRTAPNSTSIVEQFVELAVMSSLPSQPADFKE